MNDLDTFRSETRAWLETNCPASMRTPSGEAETVWGGRREKFVNPDSRVWLERMAEKGWTCPMWPKQYGGGGLSIDENRVLQQELARIDARPALSSFGIWMLGPALLEFANEEQKLEYLPKIVRGEIRWCQGYSEPGSGSDLAGLRTKAEDKGDHYLVNGSKIWTSYADEADWIFCLVRTNFDVPKHEGISFLLFDMESPGVTTRPITLISGSSPFCQTFFDNVKVPKHQLVGTLNHGWTIAKRLLQHERQMIAGIGGNSALGASGRKMEDIAKEYIGEEDGRIADPAIRSQDRRPQDERPRLSTDVGTIDRRSESGPRRRQSELGVQVLRHRAEQAQIRSAARDDGHTRGRLGRRRLQRQGTEYDAAMAAFEGEFDRRRHQRSAAERDRKTGARFAGLIDQSGQRHAGSSSMPCPTTCV